MNIENSTALKIKSLLRKRFPIALSLAGKFYAQTLGFKEVRNYLAGKTSSSSSASSLLLLSTNRSATQFVESVLAEIYKASGGVYIPLNRYLFFADSDAESHVVDVEHMNSLLQGKGYFFGQQGPFVDLGLLEGFRLVNVVRDPRDLVVSNFHSIAAAHVPKDRAFIEKIKRVQGLGLQEYALEEDFLLPIESAFKQAMSLRGRDDVLFWRYEDLMEDFEGFQSSCQKFILGKVDKNLSEKIGGMHLGSVSGEGEVKTRHRRSGRWGQFKKALNPEVVEALNARLEPYLKEFGYLDYEASNSSSSKFERGSR